MVNCRFCHIKKSLIVKITPEKYEQTHDVMDGIFNQVKVGTKTEIYQPRMILITHGRSRYIIPMPAQFKFCPNCGREIGKEEKSND